MAFERITESPSVYRHLDKMDTYGILFSMNKENESVADAVSRTLSHAGLLVDAVADRLLAGGRLFYLGAGTSGRLGVLDASECPPTFGIDAGIVIGIIAGGPEALSKAVEFAEDDQDKGWEDLQAHQVQPADFVVGISASGSTPYVIHALKKCRESGIATGCITCNPDSPVRQYADFPVEVITGPEFVTGSTRLKAGTAQKMLLNMISTAVMIKLGRVEDNTMVHMQLTNEKLIDRGTQIIMKQLDIRDYDQARNWLLKHGSVKKAIGHYRT